LAVHVLWWALALVVIGLFLNACPVFDWAICAEMIRHFFLKRDGLRQFVGFAVGRRFNNGYMLSCHRPIHFKRASRFEDSL
jgi:hypothetical protein